MTSTDENIDSFETSTEELPKIGEAVIDLGVDILDLGDDLLTEALDILDPEENKENYNNDNDNDYDNDNDNDYYNENYDDNGYYNENYDDNGYENDNYDDNGYENDNYDDNSYDGDGYDDDDLWHQRRHHERPRHHSWWKRDMIENSRIPVTKRNLYEAGVVENRASTISASYMLIFLLAVYFLFL